MDQLLEGSGRSKTRGVHDFPADETDWSGGLGEGGSLEETRNEAVHSRQPDHVIALRRPPLFVS